MKKENNILGFTTLNKEELLEIEGGGKVWDFIKENWAAILVGVAIGGVIGSQID
ncbi:Bacteriocin class II with double-glycine leader peptide [Marivirga sericea]|uniref:Bacteriocin class II with double-glycine leader peptide n=1 Tax=Marivirga sericea TaxID=1028 RepID=A0A1X7JCA4_9BACT|nr:Blp family class II bacteriocin [Marivirga sericea]SMG24719.1 Bacteriocin class II with double-glycine leader peptide [Marivirga sericea]